METPTLGIGGTILSAFNIYAIYSVMTSRASAGAQIFSTLFILAVPLLGFIVWLIAGPRRSGHARV